MPKLCIIPSRALADPEMTPTELRVLLAVGTFTSRDGTGVWASNATLAETANLDKRNMRRALLELVKRGYISKRERIGNTSVLAIVLDDPLQGGEGKFTQGGGAAFAPPGGVESTPRTTQRTSQGTATATPPATEEPAKSKGNTGSARDQLTEPHHVAAYDSLTALNGRRMAVDYELNINADGGERPGVGHVPAVGWPLVGEALHQLCAAGAEFSAFKFAAFLGPLSSRPKDRSSAAVLGPASMTSRGKPCEGAIFAAAVAAWEPTQGTR